MSYLEEQEETITIKLTKAELGRIQGELCNNNWLERADDPDSNTSACLDLADDCRALYWKLDRIIKARGWR